MMAQTQPAQGCAVCGGPSDLAPDPRETAQRSDWRGKRPLVTLGLSKVTRPSPKGGRNPFEASGLASCTAKPCRIPPQKLQSGRLRLTANRPYDGTASPHQDPSPALPFAGEGAENHFGAVLFDWGRRAVFMPFENAEFESFQVTFCIPAQRAHHGIHWR